jgi:hypothetical protein
LLYVQEQFLYQVHQLRLQRYKPKAGMAVGSEPCVLQVREALYESRQYTTDDLSQWE